MKTLISIMAHAAAQETFERHFRYWEAHKAELLVWCPDNAKVNCPGITVHTVGKAEHHGKASVDRFRYIFEHMADIGFDQYAFFEYDSICLSPELPIFGTDIAGNAFTDAVSDEFRGGMFVHPPILIKAPALSRLVQSWKGLSSEAERGYWDRWLGLAIKRAGLTSTSFIQTGQGYSHNTIHEASYPALRKAILGGATVLHGVKDRACLEVAQLARKHYDWRAELEAAGDVLVQGPDTTPACIHCGKEVIAGRWWAKTRDGEYYCTAQCCRDYHLAKREVAA